MSETDRLLPQIFPSPLEPRADSQAAAPGEGIIMLLRGMPVILDSRVAHAFGVETREVNQAAARNPHKFADHHRFQISENEREFLTSQNVISKPGRGGSRTLPYVYTQKGVARLAKVLDTPQALEATDLMIDLFVEVHQQLAAGHTQISVARPGRLFPDAGLAAHVAQIRQQLVKSISDLLSVQIDPASKTTLRDEIGEVAGGALNYLKAHLNAKNIENEKVAAETVMILEKAREVRDCTRADLAKAAVETEKMQLENFEKKLAIAERLWAMAEKFEPNEIVMLNRAFVKPSLLLRAPDPDNEPPLMS